MANVASGSANSRTPSAFHEIVLGRFAACSGVRADFKENLSELFRRGVRGAIRSSLLVEWESRGANFRRNLSHALVSPFLIPATTDTSAMPKIWSKQTLLKRFSRSHFPTTSFYSRLLWHRFCLSW
jgi:hypothetical protein